MTTTLRQQPPVLVRLPTKSHAVCRSCGAPLTWYRTLEHNKGMPFDGDPELLFTDTTAPVMTPGGVCEAIQVGAIAATAVHWRTCPQAADWRKTKAGRTRRKATA